jgi:hypothetical protein
MGVDGVETYPGQISSWKRPPKRDRLSPWVTALLHMLVFGSLTGDRHNCTFGAVHFVSTTVTAASLVCSRDTHEGAAALLVSLWTCA